MGSILARLKDAIRNLRRALSVVRPTLVRVPIVDTTPAAWGSFRKPVSLTILTVPDDLHWHVVDPFTVAARTSRSKSLRARQPIAW